MPKGQGYKSAILVAESVAKQDYMDNYEVRVAEIERKKAERQADIKRVIHEYTTFVMTEFLSKEDLEILHENIEYFAHGQSNLYKPIRSKVDNSLRSIDLMHFVWNIGERLGISLIDRATFIIIAFSIHSSPTNLQQSFRMIDLQHPNLIILLIELFFLYGNFSLHSYPPIRLFFRICFSGSVTAAAFTTSIRIFP